VKFASKRPEISRGQYYFGDKERLYIEAVKYAIAVATEGAPFPEWVRTPPVQKLRDFIRVCHAHAFARIAEFAAIDDA